MNIFNKILDICYSIENNRTKENVLIYAMSEIGELAEELNIENGLSNKTPGEDGVIGEAIDVILCMLDIIQLENPKIDENKINEMLINKALKWRDTSGY